MNIQIAIAEDHHIVRKGICELVNSFEGMEIIFEAENGQDLLDQIVASSQEPNLVLVDLEMPVLNGHETIKLLKKNHPDIHIIVLTMYESKQFIIHALQLGAQAYILKDDAPEDLKQAIEGVLENGHYFTDKVSKVMMDNIAGAIKIKPPLHDKLSPREMEVLKLIGKGLSSKEIGDKLFIAPKTVDGHKENLRQKLNAKNVTTLIINAIRNGLIDINEC